MSQSGVSQSALMSQDPPPATTTKPANPSRTARRALRSDMPIGGLLERDYRHSLDGGARRTRSRASQHFLALTEETPPAEMD